MKFYIISFSFNSKTANTNTVSTPNAIPVIASSQLFSSFNSLINFSKNFCNVPFSSFYIFIFSLYNNYFLLITTFLPSVSAVRFLNNGVYPILVVGTKSPDLSTFPIFTFKHFHFHHLQISFIFHHNSI